MVFSFSTLGPVVRVPLDGFATNTGNGIRRGDARTGPDDRQSQGDRVPGDRDVVVRADHRWGREECLPRPAQLPSFLIPALPGAGEAATGPYRSLPAFGPSGLPGCEARGSGRPAPQRPLARFADAALRTTEPRCKTCVSTLSPEGKKNVRRNTCLLVRFDHEDGRERYAPSCSLPDAGAGRRSDAPILSRRNVIIDAGKTFYVQAIEHLPRLGVRYLDGLEEKTSSPPSEKPGNPRPDLDRARTSVAADAMLGLDDLRGWTLRRAIQPTVRIFLTAETMSVVKRAFPYLVDTNAATGAVLGRHGVRPVTFVRSFPMLLAGVPRFFP
ncbi:MAG: hypothetical protein BJ554DRAFT_4883 [Olpidium bornovanus]|uniref:Uncharacterized protein n=1 Tax=Olpidium bornovanus TaxID=278681 RepID=A0A8H8A087_9FUNG|nr:MAG: hypothetical protein BJ554DRAFT_4883 [Olpidium bornovanus]